MKNRLGRGRVDPHFGTFVSDADVATDIGPLELPPGGRLWWGTGTVRHGAHWDRHAKQSCWDRLRYHRSRAIGVSIAWQKPESTVETNPVCWKIELGSLRGGFCDLFGTSCERTPVFGLTNPACLASIRRVRRPRFEGSRSLEAPT